MREYLHATLFLNKYGMLGFICAVCLVNDVFKGFFYASRISSISLWRRTSVRSAFSMASSRASSSLCIDLRISSLILVSLIRLWYSSSASPLSLQ